MFKRNPKYSLEVSYQELRLMEESLLALRERLIERGLGTSPIDRMLSISHTCPVRETGWGFFYGSLHSEKHPISL